METQIAVKNPEDINEWIISLWNCEKIKTIQKGMIHQFSSHGEIYMNFFTTFRKRVGEILKLGSHMSIFVPYPPSKFYLHAYFDSTSENAEMSLHTFVKYQTRTKGDIVFTPRVSCRYWVNYDEKSQINKENLYLHNSIAEVIGTDSFSVFEHTCSADFNGKEMFHHIIPQNRIEMLPEAPWTPFTDTQGIIYDKLGEILSFKPE